MGSHEISPAGTKSGLVAGEVGGRRLFASVRLADDVFARLYAAGMRYAQGGAADAKGRAQREAVRIQAAKLLTAEVSPEEIAKRLRVSERSVYRWKADLQRGGTAICEWKEVTWTEVKVSRR